MRPPREERFADEARFIKAWLEKPATTGAVSPSSPYLARAMAERIDLSLEGPIVELGPGTGPVTQALLRRGIAPERLVLVESDSGFCRLLERRFPGVRVVHGDAYALGKTLSGWLDHPAAAIVSGLPLLNTPEPKRLALLADAFRLMAPEAVFIQFTYGMTSPMPRRSKRARTLSFSAVCSPPIWLNLPPARIWTYRQADVTTNQRRSSAEIIFHKIRLGAHVMRREFREQTSRIRADLVTRKTRAAYELAQPNASRGGRKFELSSLDAPRGPQR